MTVWWLEILKQVQDDGVRLRLGTTMLLIQRGSINQPTRHPDGGQDFGLEILKQVQNDDLVLYAIHKNNVSYPRVVKK